MTNRSKIGRFETAQQTLRYVERLDDLIARKQERIREMEAETDEMRRVRNATQIIALKQFLTEAKEKARRHD